NGLSGYEKYVAWVESFARQLGIDVASASTYWARESIDLALVQADAAARRTREEWAALPVRGQLVAQAKKHAQGTLDFDAAATLYYCACRREAPLFRAQFPDHIFLTYNDPCFDVLLPDLPKMYVWSFKPGTSAKPWFTDAVT